jgi:hypothetical protein
MRRASAGLLLLIGLGCSGDTSPAGPKTVEFVRPAGASGQLFAFRAHQSASGQVSGYIVSRSAPDYAAPFEVEGRVTCLRVVGNRASIGGELQRTTSEILPEAPRYHGWLFYVEDNQGRPGIPDRVGEHIFVFDAPPSYCPSPAADSATVERGDGDVVISITE